MTQSEDAHSAALQERATEVRATPAQRLPREVGLGSGRERGTG